MPLDTLPLVKYIAARNPIYAAKLAEIHEIAKAWLTYIPESFPQYTRHTVEHSEEIIEQASKILFRDSDPSQPTLPLTATEGYILAVAALLHDAGMVVSDSEKEELLRSNAWSDWVANGPGAGRWAEIQQLPGFGDHKSDAAKTFAVTTTRGALSLSCPVILLSRA